MTGAFVPAGDIASAIGSWCEGRRAAARGAGPAYRLLAIAAVLIVVLVAATGFAVQASDFMVMLALLGGGVGLAWAMRWCRLARPADALEASAIVLGSSIATGCLSILLATIAPPLRDVALATADGWLFPFLSWPAMARGLAGHPSLVGAMQGVYSTLLWQPFALVALLAALGRSATMWRFLHAWLLALATCLAIFAVMPAVTAQVHYGFPPGSIGGLTLDTAWRPTHILLGVRDGTIRQLASGSMAGMIDFPSFHAAGATLLAWGFRRAGPLGRPMVALNCAMIPTIPLVGSHYFVDIVAGIALAVTVIAATRETEFAVRR